MSIVRAGSCLAPFGLDPPGARASAGRSFNCAQLDDGAVKCWGSSYYGQLGHGDKESRGDEPGEMGDALPEVDLGTGRTAVAISANGYRNCAILDHGTVKCWGFNDDSFGLLGLGDMETSGDQPGEMGDALPIVHVYHDDW